MSARAFLQMLRKIVIQTIYLNISTDSMQIKLTFGIQGEKFEGWMGLWDLNLMPSLIVIFQVKGEEFYSEHVCPLAKDTNPEPALKYNKKKIDRLQNTECQPIQWFSSNRFQKSFLQSGKKIIFLFYKCFKYLSTRFLLSSLQTKDVIPEQRLATLPASTSVHT